MSFSENVMSSDQQAPDKTPFLTKLSFKDAGKRTTIFCCSLNCSAIPIAVQVLPEPKL